MVVVTLSECPVSLRGDLTKWLLEINIGVFVGKVSARVRDNLWERICKSIRNGKATMVYSARNEQGLEFKIHNSNWEPIDFDGIKLLLRPSPSRIEKLSGLRLGYSNASKQRFAKKMKKR
jgi:CRISPR-associated protein Cas2